MSLKRSAFSAGRWTTTSTVARTILQLAQTMVLARLLLPADFGVMAVAGALLSVLALFSDLGLSRALIHYADIPRPVLSSLYWLNLAMGTLLMLALAAAAPLLGMAYHEPQLVSLTIAVSPIFLLTAIGQQFRALAEKELRFTALAVIEITATVSGFVAAVSVANLGGGVYALALGILVTAATSSLLAATFLSRGASPEARIRWAEAAPYLRFGGYQVGDSLANALHVQADTFIAGALLGPSMIGTYSLPRDLSLRIGSTINPIITRVGLPVMARLQQDRAALRSIYLQTLRMGASVNFPMYVALALFAEDVVGVLYGPRWHEAADYLRILAVWGLIRSSGNPVGSLIYAVGRPRLAFFWSATLLFVLPPMLWLGAHIAGLQGLAYTLLWIQVLIFVPLWRVSVYPLCGARLGEYVSQLAIPLAIALASAALAYAATSRLEHGIQRLAVGLTAGSLGYLSLSWFFNRQWVAAMVQLLKLRLPCRTRDAT